MFGDTLKSIREGKRLRQEEIAEKTGISVTTLSRYENNKRTPQIRELQKIAAALGCSVSELLGEGEGGNLPAEPNAKPFENIVRLPVFSSITQASCGLGNGLEFADYETEEMPLFRERSFFRAWDDLRKPFCIHVEGDSMTNARIEDGDIVVINPAEDVLDADAGLVSWKGNWFIKWVIFNIDGSVELRSANPNYSPITIEKDYACNPDFFRIIGKVVDVEKRLKPTRAY